MSELKKYMEAKTPEDIAKFKEMVAKNPKIKENFDAEVAKNSALKDQFPSFDSFMSQYLPVDKEPEQRLQVSGEIAK